MEAGTAMAAEARCPACGAAASRIFHEARSVPANSCLLLSTAAAARRCPRGDLRLAFCRGCGFVWNAAFDAARTRYTGRYEETQGFSPVFRAFHQDLARRLIARRGLRRRRILEIGCGKGDFLALLCELGDNTGVGYDPAYAPSRGSDAGGRAVYVRAFLTPETPPPPADLVVCKMTLEHVPDVAAFVGMARAALGDRRDAAAFFMVPDAARILRDCAWEDVYHEHCSYFAAGPLTRLFRAAGFRVLRVGAEFDGQYLTIEAAPAARLRRPASPEDLPELTRAVASFPKRLAASRGRWRRRLAALSRAGRRVVLWGGGSKAVAFLALVDRPGAVAAAVDVNPARRAL